MKMKKILAISMACALVLSLSACSSTGSDTAETTVSAETTSAETMADDDEAGNGSVTSTYEAGTPAAELADLFNNYNLGCSTGNENGLTVNFYNDDHTDFKQAICNPTSEQSDELWSLDWMLEDYNQQYFDILAECDGLEIVTPELPDMTEYEALAGKTVGELEDAGLEYAMCYDGEDGKTVVDFYAYPDDETTYTLHAILDIADDDNTFYDDESVKELTVKEILFWEFD